MSATASIVVQEVNNVLLIPRQAVSGSLNNPVVKVMVDGQPQERPVKLGASDDLWIEVMEGLREGEVVVVVVAEASTTQQGFPGGFRGFPGGDFPGGGMMR